MCFNELWDHVSPNEAPEVIAATRARLAATSYELFAEELGAYRDGSAIARIKKSDTVRDLVKRIDKIPPELVACVNVTELFAATHRSFWISAAFCPILSLGMPDNFRYKQYCATSPSLANQEEKDRYRKKKFMNTDHAKTLTSMVSAALRTLATESSLFYHPESFRPVVDVGAFFVEKAGDANLLRVIVDGRFANLVYSTTEAKFSFFSLEVLRQVIDNLSTSPNWFAVNIDLRHWFHEIPLPIRYQKIFGLPLTDRDNKRGDYYLVPRAFPMGWSFSPLICQAFTWSLVLSKHDEGSWGGAADLDLHELSRHQTLFSWVPFKRGGGIFVLLDNILVVTPHQETARFWMKKIREDADRYNIHLKTKEDPAYPNATKEELLERQCFRHLTKDSNATFDFLGITWAHSTHWVKIKDSEDREFPNVSKTHKNMQDDGTWLGTYQQLASVIGRINWHRRVHGLRNFDDPDDRVGTRTLLKLFTIMTPPEGKTWNSTVALGKDTTDGLTRAWRFRCGAETSLCKAVPLSWDAALHDVMWFATDAAKTKLLHRAVFVQYDVLSKLPRTAVADTPRLVHTFDFPEEDSIALGELYAILVAVKTVTARNALVILATDSMNAKRWVEAAKADNPTALKYLFELFQHMKQYDIRVYLVYVPSKKNVADHSTRPHLKGKQPAAYLEQPFQETRHILARADAEARKTWTAFGARTGGMDVQLHEDSEAAPATKNDS
jgi:hypothetical protein